MLIYLSKTFHRSADSCSMLTLVKLIHATEKMTETTHIPMITAIVLAFPKCQEVFSGWQITMYLKETLLFSSIINSGNYEKNKISNY